MILTKATLSEEHISFWLLRIQLLWMMLRSSFDILMFRWRSLSLLGVFCVTGFPQKQTWFSRHLTYCSSSVRTWVLVRWSRLIINLSFVVLLVLFGHYCIRGLAFRWWSTLLFVIISFSSLFQQVVPGHVALLCSSFGSRALGWCGRREITGFSVAQRALFINCWTRSSSSHLGGWRRRVLL
jgi:hypothetical protein